MGTPNTKIVIGTIPSKFVVNTLVSECVVRTTHSKCVRPTTVSKCVVIKRTCRSCVNRVYIITRVSKFVVFIAINYFLQTKNARENPERLYQN